MQFFFKLVSFFNFIQYVTSEKSEIPLRNLNNNDSEIHLVVSGGEQNILSNNY